MTEGSLSRLKRFMMNVQFVEHELDRLESAFAVDLKREHQKQINEDDAYYPQIEIELRAEAANMAPHYEVFYSLERTIRRFINETLNDAEGDGWWTAGVRVPPAVKGGAEERMTRERDTGMTLRSTDPLDFTNFGELGEIIKANWDLFGGTLSSKKAVERVMSQLNSLRGPIAHCAPLAEDEVVRLRLSVRDWFRLTE